MVFTLFAFIWPGQMGAGQSQVADLKTGTWSSAMLALCEWWPLPRTGAAARASTRSLAPWPVLCAVASRAKVRTAVRRVVKECILKF